MRKVRKRKKWRKSRSLFFNVNSLTKMNLQLRAPNNLPSSSNEDHQSRMRKGLRMSMRRWNRWLWRRLQFSWTTMSWCIPLWTRLASTKRNEEEQFTPLFSPTSTLSSTSRGTLADSVKTTKLSGKTRGQFSFARTREAVSVATTT